MSVRSPSDQVDRLIADLNDWRGVRLAQIRRVMLEAVAGMVEEWKWMGTPTWSCDGIVAIANPHKEKVKITFAHGAHLPDPRRLFNAGLGGREWRAVDLFESDPLDEPALKEMVRAAASYNRSLLATHRTSDRRAGPARSTTRPRSSRRPK